MNDFSFEFHGARLSARPGGTLWWADEGMLVVSDLHLGKAERMARRGGAMLPPYETAETLDRLAAEIAATDPAHVVALGDSFDDLAAAGALDPDIASRLADLVARQDWTWITGNHDPGPSGHGGTNAAQVACRGLVFRHIAAPRAVGEISGHYHPKARLALGGGTVTRRCFLVDEARIVMPAFGTYTGGLDTTDPALSSLMDPGAVAVLTGRRAMPVRMPRATQARRSA